MSSSTPPDFAVDCSRHALAWLLGDSRLVDAEAGPLPQPVLTRTEHVFVYCDFVDPVVPLSDDARVVRARCDASERLIREFGFERAVHVWLHPARRPPTHPSFLGDPDLSADTTRLLLFVAASEPDRELYLLEFVRGREPVGRATSRGSVGPAAGPRRWPPPRPARPHPTGIEIPFP